MELAVKVITNDFFASNSVGYTTMEKVKIAYPITDSTSGMPPSKDSFVFKSIVASLAGASIPAVIFYFLM